VAPRPAHFGEVIHVFQVFVRIAVPLGPLGEIMKDQGVESAFLADMAANAASMSSVECGSVRKKEHPGSPPPLQEMAGLRSRALQILGRQKRQYACLDGSHRVFLLRVQVRLRVIGISLSPGGGGQHAGTGELN